MAIKTGDLTTQLTIRISEKLKAQIANAASEERKNLAEWVREVLEKAVEEK